MKEYSGEILDCIVIGGGQAGLACGYYLQKTNLNYLILDEQEKAGGAWLHTWDSLRIFSPPEQSSLPGYIMPKDDNEYPSKNHVINYLSDYEKRYNLPMERPVSVKDVDFDGEIYFVKSDTGMVFKSKTVIAATGTWKNPYLPNFIGLDKFQGRILHSASYKSPETFEGKNIMIIGAGNSAAQIYADLFGKANLYWCTKESPTFLPDYVDGRYLFNTATSRYKEYLKSGEKKAENHLGFIVQVEPVKKLVKEENMLYYDMFEYFTENEAVWKDGKKAKIDVIIYCTGFKSSISYLENLKIMHNNRIKTKGTRAENIKGLWLVGFGDWTGYASATLIGVGRTAKKTVEEIREYLQIISPA
jgi:thioredoxin reductase